MNIETKISIHRKESPMLLNFDLNWGGVVDARVIPKHACPQFASAYTTWRMLSSVSVTRYYVIAHFLHYVAVVVTQKLHGHGLYFLSINAAQSFFESYEYFASNDTAYVVETTLWNNHTA
jgi:hypothetical protein